MAADSPQQSEMLRVLSLHGGGFLGLATASYVSLETNLLLVELALLQKQQRPHLLDRIGKICGRRLRHDVYVRQVASIYKTLS